MHRNFDSIEQCREACVQISGSQSRPGFEYRQSDVGQMAHDSTVKGTPAATSGKKPPIGFLSRVDPRRALGICSGCSAKLVCLNVFSDALAMAASSGRI